MADRGPDGAGGDAEDSDELLYTGPRVLFYKQYIYLMYFSLSWEGPASLVDPCVCRHRSQGPQQRVWTGFPASQTGPLRPSPRCSRCSAWSAAGL